MEKITLNVEFLASLLGQKDAGSFAELLKSADGQPKPDDEVENLIKSELTKKLDAAKSAGKKESHGRALRETAEEIEKKIAESLGVEKAGVDEMIEAWKTENLKSFKAKPDDIKNSDVYIQDIKTEREKYKTLEATFQTEKSNWENSAIQDTARKRGLEVISEHGYILPEDKAKMNNQLNLFFSSLFTSPDVKLKKDGDNIKVYDKDGNPVRNDLMDEVNFDHFLISKLDTVFDKAAAGGKKSAENKTAGSGAGNIPLFTTPEEYVTALNAEKDEKVRDDMYKVYSQKVKSGEIVE
jgi:hypothetical protein